ncbi:MAG: IMP dehydrogenase, partial [Polyangiaceae bacterium]
MAQQPLDPRAVPVTLEKASDRGGAITRSETWRRFELFDPAAPPPKPPSGAPLLLIPVVVTALVVVAVVRSMLVRALLPLAIAMAAIAVWMQRSRRRARAEREREQKRSLVLTGSELLFSPGGAGEPLPMMDLTAPFGATLLSTHRRDRLVLMLTTEHGAFHVGTQIDAPPSPALTPLFARATTIAGEDAAFEAIGPDGDPVLLSPEGLAAFVDVLSKRDPACLDRVVVTDTRGGKVMLDGGHLRVDSLAFDLTAPLEWRALVFQEPFGQVMTLYQGTWIRQNGSEVVLVSLLPSLGPILDVEPGEIASLDRAVLRDLRLMQATAEVPPPREQRHAIERLMMMPIRSSLDRAP